MIRDNQTKIIEEEWNKEEETFKIVLTGKGKKKYKQTKRLLDLLRMKWFD